MKTRQWEPSCSIRTDGRTDTHDKANSRFAQFCERASKLESAITTLCARMCFHLISESFDCSTRNLV